MRRGEDVGAGNADKPLHSRDGGSCHLEMSSPIVDDESCDLLCRWQKTLAKAIETDGAFVEDVVDAVGLEALTFHVG